MSNRTCSIDDCSGCHYARGYCKAHYDRWRRRDDALAEPVVRKTCVIDGCAGWRVSHGWCSKHYTRWRRYGDPLHTERGYQVVEHDGYALLPLHNKAGEVVAYTKVDLADVPWLTAWRWSRNRNGYAYRATDRTLLLHRVILGIVDEPREVMCDHINRDRLDNRSSNLRRATAKENRANTEYVYHGRGSRGPRRRADA
jgi:hypothetical protein